MNNPTLSAIDALNALELNRAFGLNAFLDIVCLPTPAQVWLERAANDLQRQRDPDGEKKARRDKLVIRLLQRDGDECWYCGGKLGKDVTLEHLQPRALNGTWAESNLVLAHRGCNKAAGHLTRIKKEAMREELRANGAGGRSPAPRAREGDAR